MACSRVTVGNPSRKSSEVLDASVFESLDRVREITAERIQECNEERPHDPLNGIPPS